jgi:8-oxo-dGTP pyrophosphatase MutT (NUDIX family)
LHQQTTYMSRKIYFDEEPRIVEDTDELLKKFKLIMAAGGLVTNDEGKILLIFRRNKWDLPKGKFEPGETIEQCAGREVIEETGLSELNILKPLLVSYHTYEDKKVYYLKETHWFLFNAPGKQFVVPQTEEDITRIEWVGPGDLGEYTSNTFGLIKDVLSAGGF